MGAASPKVGTRLLGSELGHAAEIATSVSGIMMSATSKPPPEDVSSFGADHSARVVQLLLDDGTALVPADALEDLRATGASSHLAVSFATA